MTCKSYNKIGVHSLQSLGTNCRSEPRFLFDKTHEIHSCKHEHNYMLYPNSETHHQIANGYSELLRNRTLSYETGSPCDTTVLLWILLKKRREWIGVLNTLTTIEYSRCKTFNFHVIAQNTWYDLGNVLNWNELIVTMHGQRETKMNNTDNGISGQSINCWKIKVVRSHE